MDERVAMSRFAVALPSHETPEHDAAGADDKEGEREAEDRDRRVLGFEPSPGARFEHPEHEESQTGGGEHRADDVELRRGRRTGRVFHLAGHEQDEGGDEDLADEHDPPRELGRRPTAHDRTDRDPGTGDATDHRVGRLAAGAFEVAGDQRRERREDERGADAFEDRPSQRQDGHRLRRRGQRRAARIDDQADDERPSTADDVADLGAGEDQHRHHQAVEGDDGLDRGHRGVEVLDQLTDRDVHHRLVEHHEELRRRQRHQRRAGLARFGVHNPPTRPPAAGSDRPTIMRIGRVVSASSRAVSGDVAHGVSMAPLTRRSRVPGCPR